MNQTQTGIPTVVTEQEVAREKTLGGSIELCAKAAGFDLDKTLQGELEVDKGQFSRWKSGQEGIVWPKLLRLMDVCGNHAPVLWMLYQLGYDLNSLRRRETELEQKVRELTEQLERERSERAVERRLIRELRVTA